MEKRDKFVLIGNYAKDRQESMERFAQMLFEGFSKAGYTTSIWRPKVLFGSFFKSTTSGLGKWFGYVDKWIIFPVQLRLKLLLEDSKNIHYHVCDHSNAPYLTYLPKTKTAITCHDVLAIRGALGHADAYCPASKFGKVLQKWILHNLQKAKLLAAVSQFTLKQLVDLGEENSSYNRNWQVIYNSFNASFSPVNIEDQKRHLSNAGINTSVPYILHVGSSLPRKNRALLLDMVAILGNQWTGNICFAGKAIDNKLKSHAEKLGLQGRIVSIVKPDHATLLALYSACEAFVFPSFSEGFGWPVIEAQACGAPVIASSIEPMPEISGGAALHADPTNAKEFANALLSLQNPPLKNKIVNAGFQNCLRFKKEPIINDYLTLHNAI